jgi:hypothetical protein
MALAVSRPDDRRVKCRVYDLVNFASEVATHMVDPAEQAKEFADLLLEDGKSEAR